MNVVCEMNQCNGCYACVEKCSVNAISILDNLHSINAVIDNNKCMNCGLCRKICPNLKPVLLKPPIDWKQGWTKDVELRNNSSSGGVASALMKAFILSGGYVCTVKQMDGEFKFFLTNNLSDLKGTNGSKYVKSVPKNVYSIIVNLLKNNNKVLFIGLPCQIAGIKKFVGIANSQLLYTVDLICHGSPSLYTLNKFFDNYGDSVNMKHSIIFRLKNNEKTDYKYYSTSGTMDSYTIAFINGLTYTDNCYNCRYASTNRCSDLSIGDSWGSNISVEEQNKGISLMLIQSSKGKELLNMSNLHMEEVDCSKAIQHNHQLVEPMRIPKRRGMFFKLIERNFSFNKAVLLTLPYYYFKQKLKAVLIEQGVIKVRNGIKFTIGTK